MTDDPPKPEHSPNAEFLAWLAREHPEIKGADAMISAGVRLAAEAFLAGKATNFRYGHKLTLGTE